MTWTVLRAGLGWEAGDSDYPGVRFNFQRIHEERDDTKSDLTVFGPELGEFEHPNFNLRSVRTRESVGKLLNERCATFKQWVPLIHSVCNVMLKAMAEGEPAWDVDVDQVTVRPIEYLIDPLLPLAAPSILFGPAGTSKSYLSLAIAASCATGTTFIPDMPNRVRGPVVYLDYEMTADNFGIRLKRLLTTHHLSGRVGIRRLAMARPLADDMERVARAVTDSGAALLIIDPCGPAAGAASEWARDDTKAERLYGSLREMGVTSLIVDHVAKANLRNTDETSASGAPIGTVVKYNRARSVWEVRRSEDTTAPGAVYVALKHWKANDSPIHDPMGYVIHHYDDRVEFERADLSDLSDATSGTSTGHLITGLLSVSKPMTASELSDAIARKPAAVRQALSRLQRRGQVIRLDGGRYALLAEEPPGGSPPRVN